VSTHDVLQIAKRFLSKVKPSGPENIMAACPFHRKSDGSEEKTPSFTMSLTRGLYYCFSCHERGSLKKFLFAMGVPHTHVEQYSSLLEELERYRPPRVDPTHLAPIVEEPLPESLLGIFDLCPTALLAEGFTEATLRAFDVGFDTKHARITYPLRDCSGMLVGVSGRSSDGTRPRYKVYDTEYEVWELRPRKTRKAGLLWNCHNVLPELYFAADGVGAVVIVEGFKACMWLHQAGIRTTVALLGSFMSKDQHILLERMGARAEKYVMLDNDDAGFEGRLSVGRELAKSSHVRIVEYDADQPSDLSPDELLEALAGATEYHLWKIRRQTAQVC
jgi:DNA primase